jgi:hypothetical protein
MKGVAGRMWFRYKQAIRNKLMGLSKVRMYNTQKLYSPGRVSLRYDGCSYSSSVFYHDQSLHRLCEPIKLVGELSVLESNMTKQAARPTVPLSNMSNNLKIDKISDRVILSK